jgi:IS5 family transposase
VGDAGFNRDGYKAHIAVEPETGLITAAALTPASAPDGPTGVELLAGEAPGLQVLADSAYGSGATRAKLRAAEHRQAIKPLRLRRAIPGGFDRDDFIIDRAARTATCPAGHTVTITPKNNAIFGTRCRSCSLRHQCTNAKDGRTLEIGEHDAELVEARRAWCDGDFAHDYRRYRPMVERSIAWIVARGHRRVAYRGVERNQHALSLRVAAINLRRLLNLDLTRTSTGPGHSAVAGPGADKRGTTPRQQSHQGDRPHTPNSRLFGSVMAPGHATPSL